MRKEEERAEQPIFTKGVDVLRRLLESIKAGDDTESAQISADRDEVIARFGPVFSPENVGRLTAGDFKDFLSFKNNKHWKHIHRHQGSITSDMPKLRHALSVLVDESKPIIERLNFLVPTMAGAKFVSGLSKTILTPILLVVYPERYGVWNDVSRAAMEQLGLWPKFRPQDQFGERYVRVNDTLLRLSQALETDLWTLDWLWWKVQSAPDETEDKNKARPVHLLFKWAPERDPDTVVKHRLVAESHGSVWWGKLGNPETSGMREEKLNQLRKQLSSETDTYAFLYRRGEVWRTRLLEITTDPSEVDHGLRPQEFAQTQCHLYARLSDFEELPPEWIETHLVPAGNPSAEGMMSALRNQTSPLLVYERPKRMEESEDRAEGEDAAPSVRLTREWLEEQTLWEQAELEELLDAISGSSPQIVLAGPPGTGKTWVAEHVARFLTNDAPGGFRLVQLHPSYGYEQFIEGLRPTIDESRVFDFKPVEGVVLEMARDIRQDGRTRVLLMDEMNRANLPRVFGELMYLFEYRQKPADLLYTKNFRLPENLLFIGTMNTADRSIRSIDIALRRRFEVFECPPDVRILERFYSRHENGLKSLFTGFEALNAELRARLDRHHAIGHTFFMSRSGFDAARLLKVWRRKIGPLIEEYFFDQPDVAAEFSPERYWPEASGAD